MIETIEYKGTLYPKFQAEGFSAKFIFPFADQVCKGVGYDIGYCKDEWKLPSNDNRKVIGVDISNSKDDFHALNLPHPVDFVFSSHCLEHIFDWVEVLDYWTMWLKPSGVLFLYLPHPDQEYWLPFNNRKHKNYLTPELMHRYIFSTGKFTNIFISQRDLNHSFAVMAEKI